ncbi:EamA family transporter [Desulfitobacterium hafniense]|uniref:EamA domain-containing protein n=1 Tax=Desulfitobacterium hafniense (strain Y51) TaxID=138119 RepID=Q24N36_DESHY|nr:hypothetical protein DSY4767 [Desulfitobacterium hafniense Y51]
MCFVMWNTAINLIGVFKADNYIYLIPLIIMMTAFIILHEKITILAILGDTRYDCRHGNCQLSMHFARFAERKGFSRNSCECVP